MARNAAPSALRAERARLLEGLGQGLMRLQDGRNGLGERLTAVDRCSVARSLVWAATRLAEIEAALDAHA